MILRQVTTRLEASLHHKIRLDLKRKEECQRVGRPDVPADTDDSSALIIRREINPLKGSFSLVKDVDSRWIWKELWS
ncbi:hypothetical protein PN498_17900 [Oscillatoria sp. CS-180]|uniref:hypothetical protein n=1 Tax=Oscillatoria sp. CS-180 TaxID=3021720 RepID=UPI00232FD67E|nr:hypothetical protein [Oscillatoria sp. CS-180]MDB9527874.1 hypothetical protein [Oscillatoria sp. CS-180]